MEAKLAAYRAEKKRQFEEQKRREWLAGAYLSAKGLLTRRKVAPSDGMETSDAVAMETEPMLGRTSPVQSEPAAEEGAAEGWGWSALDWLMLALKVALYLTLFAIACHYQFGAAFIVVTAIPIIYFRWERRRRRPSCCIGCMRRGRGLLCFEQARYVLQLA